MEGDRYPSNQCTNERSFGMRLRSIHPKGKCQTHLRLIGEFSSRFVASLDVTVVVAVCASLKAIPCLIALTEIPRNRSNSMKDIWTIRIERIPTK